MEIVVFAAVAALAGIALYAALSSKKATAREVSGRAALQDMIARGVEPVSLHPVVDAKKCVGTGACVEACPEVDVIAVLDGLARVIHPNACIGHAECVISCPVDAVTLVMGTAKRGVELPRVDKHFETKVQGLYVVGELGGMGLIYNAMTQALQCMAQVVKTAPPRVAGVHQVLVVGAGPAGLAASLAAREAKLDCVTVDQESLGGTVLHYPRHKIVMTKPVKLPLYGKLHLTTVSKEALLETFQDILTKTGLEVRTGVKVEGVVKQGDVFEVTTSAGVLRAQRVVLALGRRGSPKKLGVPGEELPKVTYRLLEPESYRGAKVLVVGGGDSAIEAALALAEAGAGVALSYRGAAFSRIKPANQQRIDGALQGGKVQALLQTNVVEIKATEVVLDKGPALPNDYVLVFAGGDLPTTLLKNAGIEVSTARGEVIRA